MLADLGGDVIAPPTTMSAPRDLISAWSALDASAMTVNPSALAI